MTDSTRVGAGKFAIWAAIEALIWLYAHAIVQQWTFGGNTPAMHDFGLSTLIPACLLSLAFGWVLFVPLLKRFSSQACWRGWIISAIITVPIWIALFGLLRPNYHGYPSEAGSVGHRLAQIFYLLGGFGLLPEGRRDFAAVHTTMFIGVFIANILGYLVSGKFPKRSAGAALLLIAVLSGVRRASSYGVPTHEQYLTIEAVDLLNNVVEVPLLEMNSQKGNLARGTSAEDEDFGGTSPVNHFYRPTDQSGLFGTFSSARQRMLGQDSFGTNWVQLAVDKYKAGFKDEAYINLGHVLHLAAQDMYSPPHVSNDPHLTLFGGRVDFAPDSYEPWVESQFNAIRNNPLHVGAQVPAVVWPPTATLHNSAVTTYNAARIPGALIQDENNPASGAIRAMFPPGANQGLSYQSECVAVDNEGFCTRHEGVWRISNYGQCRENTGLQGNPGNFENWWTAQNFSGETGTFFYIEDPAIAFPAVYKDGSSTGGRNLAALWALDKERLIAKSQETTAGILAAFARQVDPVRASVELRQNDSQGNIIPIDGTGAGGGTIYVKARDPGCRSGVCDPDYNQNFPIASGIYKITLKNLDTGTDVAVSPALPATGENPAERIFPNLAEGHYELKVLDGLGNDTSVNFNIDTTPPRISVTDSQNDLSVSTNPEDPIPISNGRTVDILVEDYGPSPTTYGTGPGAVEIWEGDPDFGTLVSSTVPSALDYLYDFTSADIPNLSDLPAGVLSIRAYDKAGNSSIVKINVVPLPAVTLSVGFQGQLYDEFTGSPAISRSTLVLPQALSGFTAQASINDSLNSIVLLGPNHQPVPLTIATINGLPAAVNPSQLPSDTDEVTGYFPTVDIGTYTFSAFGSSATILSFRVADLDAAIDTGSASSFINSGIGQMTGDITLDLASLVGLASADQYNPLSRNIVNTNSLTGNNAQLLFSIASLSSQSVDSAYLIKDLDGNTTKADLSAIASPFVPVVPLGLSAGSGNGSFNSQIFDCWAQNILPGAVIRVGTYLHYDNRIETTTAVGYGYADVPASGSIVDFSHQNVLMSLTITLVTGDDPALTGGGLNSVTLFSGSISTAGLQGTSPTINVPLRRYYRLDASFTSATNSNYVNYCLDPDPSNPQNCLAGKKTIAFIDAIHPDSLGIQFNLSTGPVAGTHFAVGSNQRAPLGMGWNVSNLNVVDSGGILLFAINQNPPPGYQSFPPNTAFDLGQYSDGVSNPNSPGINSGPATFTLTFSSSGLTAGQLSMMKLSPVDNGENFGADITTFNVVGNSIVFNADYQNTGSFGRYMLMVPKFPTPSLVSLGDISILSNVPGITISSADPNGTVLSGLLKNVPVGSLNGTPYVLGPEGTRFPEGAVVTMNYISQPGDPYNTLSELSSEHSALVLPGQYHGYQRRAVSGYLSQIASYFAPFATLPSASDHTPPASTLSFDGPVSTDAAGNFVVPATSSMVLTAVDPIVPGEATTGVSAIHYLVDQSFVSLSSTPGTSYMMPFSLDAGSHTLTYFSVDHAGNQETPRTSTVPVFVPISADSTPPVTSVGFTGTVSTGPAGTYIAGSSLIGFAAYDPVVSSAVTSGVATTYFLVDQPFVSLAATPPNTSTMPFSLAEGTHTVTYFSSDLAGNLEVAHSSSVNVDATSPLSFFEVVGSSSSDLYGNPIIPPDSAVALSAYDPFVNGVASGVSDIFYVVDADPTSPECQNVALDTSAPNGTCANELYDGPFTLDPGTHTVYFMAEDNVQNQEAVNVASITVIASTNFVYVAVSPDGQAALTSGNPDETILNVSTANASQAAQAATNQGLSLVGPFFYLLQPNPLTFSPPATLSLTLQRTVDLSSVTLFGYNGVSWDSAAVTAQQFVLTSTSAAQLTGTITQAGPYAAFVPQLSGPPPPPVTVLDVGDPNYAPSTSTIYATEQTSFILSAGSGTLTYLALDTTTFTQYSGLLFNLTGEGLHTLAFYSVDSHGQTEPPQFVNVGVDLTPPDASLDVQGSSVTDAQGNITVASGTAIALQAVDPVVNGVASGVSGAFYLVDADPRDPACQNIDFDPQAPNGTCANPFYAGPFVLDPGTHTVFYVAQDNVDNQGYLNESTVTVTGALAAGYQVAPAAGPIGAPFTVSGTGFGAYAGGNTQVKFGDVSAPLSVWNDTTITGTIPGLSTGAYAVTLQRQNASSVTVTGAGTFTVVAPAPAGFSPSSGPIGVPFTVTGTGFGPYAGTLTRFLFDGVSAPLSVWNDTTITGTVPNLGPGVHPVWIERASPDGGLSSSGTGYFTVTVPSVTAISASSGPIGAAFTLTGASFGPYAGAQTVALIGGTTAPLSVWNDTTIVGTVPGSLMPGTYPLVVERLTNDGGLTAAATIYYQVVAPYGASFSPPAGPIGIPFSITGAGFGAYGGANTVVLIGGTTAALSVWNDTSITGTIPAISTGAYPVVVERIQGTGVSSAAVATFNLTALAFTGPTPSSGPIGVPFTLTGPGFGPYAGANSRVLFGGVAASLSVWNDNTITGTVPPVPAGAQPLWIERQTGTGVESSATTYFEVTAPDVASLAPSSAPIGAPFTIHGASFGPYAGANTRVKFNGVVAPVSVWNDTTITGTVPGAVSTGPAVVVVERAAGTGLTSSATQAFEVLLPTIATMTPVSGTAGTAVTISGFGFGPYAGTATKLLINGSTAALSVWNDTSIHWTVPAGLADGAYPVLVVRSPAGGTVQSDPVTFTVGGGVGVGAYAAAQSAPLASLPDERFQGDMNLPASEGGRIQTPSQAAVEIPAGALDQDTEITVARDRSDHASDRAAALERDGLGAGGEAISFGPEGTQFSRPVIIELPYDPALVPPGKLNELAVNYFDPTSKTWSPLASTVDAARHVVTAFTTHFSLYQPLGHGIGVAAADAGFGFKAVYVFPNPVRGVNTATFRVQPGQADGVEVRVYDLAGRKVYSSSNFSNLGAFDDGNGLGAQFTYENTWDISGVGSGVYTYVITAHKAGQRDINKSGKVGVIK